MKYKFEVFKKLDHLTNGKGKDRAMRTTMYKATSAQRWMEYAFVVMCIQLGYDRERTKRQFDKLVRYPDGYKNDHEWKLFNTRWNTAQQITPLLAEAGMRIVPDTDDEPII